MKYENIPQYDTNLSGNEGHRLELFDLVILKPIDEKYLNTLVTHYHDYDFESYECNEYGPSFESEHSTWLEVYKALLNGDRVDSLSSFEMAIFEELHKEGYINNCWVSNLHYYETKYRSYCLEVAPPVRIKDDGQPAFTAEQLIEDMLEQGTIKEFSTGYYIKTTK